MDKSTPRATSRVFVSGFQNFNVVYIPAQKVIVTEFRGSESPSWSASRIENRLPNAKGSATN